MDEDDVTPRLPWIKPTLDLLGTMDDVRSNAGGDDDGFGFPADPVMAS